MHQLLFIHKIIFSSTCFEPQVLIFRTIQLYTCSIWYCHSLWEFLAACRYTAWVRTVYYSPLHASSLKCSSSGGYSCIHAAYGTVTVRGGLSVHSLSENWMWGGKVVGRAYQHYQQPPERRNKLFSVHNMKVFRWHRGTAPLIHNPVQMPGIIEDENFLSMLRTNPGSCSQKIAYSPQRILIYFIAVRIQTA